jgi:hypothetical protein
MARQSSEDCGDRDFVLAAVGQDGGALGCASAELKGDREVVLAAVGHLMAGHCGTRRRS